MSSTETSLTLTKAMAQKVLANAQAVYEEALNLLGDAFSLVVPNVEWQFMKRQADQHSEEALRIKEVADQLMVEHSQVLEEATFQSESASELLAKGIRQQQMTDELLVDADSALAKAKDAVLLGDKTLEEAQKTLKTLEGISNSNSSPIHSFINYKHLFVQNSIRRCRRARTRRSRLWVSSETSRI